MRFSLSAMAVAMVIAVITMPAMAGSSLYNIDLLLAQPHPFASAGGTPPPALAPVAAKSAQPARVAAIKLGASGAIGPGATTFSGSEEDTNDPLEPLNRAFFGFNRILESVLFGPVARSYNEFVPEFVRTGIGNFLDNLSEPIVLANDLLQFEPKRAYNTVIRLVANTTIGFVGIFDVAESLGYPAHDEDFGQTLGVWGVGEMFYLVLPVLGPSNPRDAVGKLFVDGFFDPVGLYLANTDQTELKWTRTGVGGIVEFAGVVDDLDKLRETSVDYYGAIRSLYRQKRKSEIANGDTIENLPDFDLNLEDVGVDAP